MRLSPLDSISLVDALVRATLLAPLQHRTSVASGDSVHTASGQPSVFSGTSCPQGFRSHSLGSSFQTVLGKEPQVEGSQYGSAAHSLDEPINPLAAIQARLNVRLKEAELAAERALTTPEEESRPMWRLDVSPFSGVAREPIARGLATPHQCVAPARYRAVTPPSRTVTPAVSRPVTPPASRPVTPPRAVSPAISASRLAHSRPVTPTRAASLLLGTSTPTPRLTQVMAVASSATLSATVMPGSARLVPGVAFQRQEPAAAAYPKPGTSEVHNLRMPVR